MVLDASIIQSGTAPNFVNDYVSGAKDAMNMASLSNKNQSDAMTLQTQKQQFGDDLAMRNAKDDNTTIGPDGKATIDTIGTMKDLASGSSPHLAMQYSQEATANANAMAQQKMQMEIAKNDFAGKLLNGVHDQASYDAARANYGAAGNDVSQLQPQYDPETVRGYLARTMSYKDTLDFQQKQLEEQNKRAQLGLELQKNQMDRDKFYGQSGQTAPGYQPPSGSGSTPTLSNADPSQFIKTMPQDRQAKALDEIGNNTNIAKIASPSLDAFNQAAKDTRPFTGGLGISGTAFNPWMESPGQKAFSGLANTTVKDVEGTARQAAFDSIAKNFRPQFGDSDATIASKRAGWIQYLQSHSASPTNDAYGNHLSKYSATSINPSLFASSSNSGKYMPTAQEAKDELAKRQQSITAVR
jgi:hypothetical protein